MASHKHREDAILFVGSLFSRIEVFEEVACELEKNFGSILYKPPSLPWNFTEYYSYELDSPIYRNFIFFDTVIDPVCLVDAKLLTADIEQSFSTSNGRQINLDPGYLTLAKVVLASKKNYSHRIYLGKGIFAELELFYKDGRFNPMPYTYFDYKDTTFLRIFTEARSLFKKNY